MKNKSESQIQQKIRLSTVFTGGLLLRNNSGSARELRRGGELRHIRYGLGNDSGRLNKKFKSSDLIGITPVTIRKCHVGRVFGVFTGIEAKAEDWVYRGTELEKAQLSFIRTIKQYGGIGAFAVTETDYLNAITEFIQ